MSPARSKRQAPIPHRRSRADLVKAIAVAAAIVLGTALFVWLMRPGPTGTHGTGGLLNRQPRSSWLVGVALGVAGSATWFTLRGPRTAKHVKVVLPIVLGVVLIAAVVGGIMWPGGLLRHDIAPPKPLPTTSTTTTKPGPGGSTTTAAGSSTTKPGATSTSGASGTTPTTAAGATTTLTPTTAANPTTTKGP